MGVLEQVLKVSQDPWKTLLLPGKDTCPPVGPSSRAHACVCRRLESRAPRKQCSLAPGGWGACAVGCRYRGVSFREQPRLCCAGSMGELVSGRF